MISNHKKTVLRLDLRRSKVRNRLVKRFVSILLMKKMKVTRKRKLEFCLTAQMKRSQDRLIQ